MRIMRFTWKAKTGCRAEVIRLVKAMVVELSLTPRVCTYMYGAYDIVTSYLEFETEEDQNKFWNNIDTSQPAWVEFHKKLPDLVESHWSELLQVH